MLIPFIDDLWGTGQGGGTVEYGVVLGYFESGESVLEDDSEGGRLILAGAGGRQSLELALALDQFIVQVLKIGQGGSFSCRTEMAG